MEIYGLIACLLLGAILGAQGWLIYLVRAAGERPAGKRRQPSELSPFFTHAEDDGASTSRH